MLGHWRERRREREREREREWPLYWMSATNSQQFQFALLVCACHLSTGTDARSTSLLDYEDITNESWLYETAAGGYVITHVCPTCTVRPHKSSPRNSGNIARSCFLRDRREGWETSWWNIWRNGFYSGARRRYHTNAVSFPFNCL